MKRYPTAITQATLPNFNWQVVFIAAGLLTLMLLSGTGMYYLGRIDGMSWGYSQGLAVADAEKAATESWRKRAQHCELGQR